jgi:hypothetical protein
VAGWRPCAVSRALQRAGGLGDGAVQLGAAPGRQRGLRRAQLQGQRDQALLGAVVQVPFDPPARLVAGRDDPRARGGELGVQPGVVRGDGELAGDELEAVRPFGGERAAEEAVFQKQHRPQ